MSEWIILDSKTKHDKGCSRKMAMRDKGGGERCPCGYRWRCY